MKKILLFIVIVIFFGGSTASAQTINDNHFASGENLVIEGNYQKDLFLFGTNINFAGTVRGDLFLFGQNIKIRGDVEGNVFFLAGNIESDTYIGGSLRGVAQQVSLKNRIGKNVTLVAQTIDSTALVGWHGYFTATNMNIGGEFERLDVKAVKAELGPRVYSALVISSPAPNSRIVISKTAEIDGNIDYQGPNKLQVDEGAVIHGQVSENLLTVKKYQQFSFDKIFWWLVFLFGLLAVGLVLINFLDVKILTFNNIITTEKFSLLTSGLAIFFLVPLLIIILFVSFIGIPLSLLLLFIYFALFYLVQILLAIWLGDLLLSKVSNKPKLTPINKKYLFWCLVVGAVIWRLLLIVPVFGSLLHLLFFLLLLGAMWRKYKLSLKETKI